VATISETLKAAPIVFVVDDDVSIRESLELLIHNEGWLAETFSSADEFLTRPQLLALSCLVLDISLPGISGLDLQKRITDARSDLPIIFITAYGDVPKTVQAMKAGAIEFLAKPFTYDALVDAIRQAIERSKNLVCRELEMQELQGRWASLSTRERAVMALVVRGLLNKQTASALGISEITVKAHRGRVMEKMKVDSLAALVTVAARLGLPGPSES
jgi:FixJ family two-component response regulator